MVAIMARLAGISGAKVVSAVPIISSRSTQKWMPSWYQALRSRSVKTWMGQVSSWAQAASFTAVAMVTVLVGWVKVYVPSALRVTSTGLPLRSVTVTASTA